MSGHSKWSSIKHQKGVADARRGKLFTKLTREIMVAVRDGGTSPDTNFRLRLAMQKARDNSMPTDNIERAIIHWYSGPWHILEAMVEHGFYFTIGVEVMFSQHIQNIAGYLPSELILTETDNPGGYKSITGNVGNPLLIKEVIGKMAEIRGVSEQIIVTTVQNNLIRIGGNDPWLARLLSSMD